MSNLSVQQMFQETAERLKTGVAIEYADRSITYATLDTASNSLANFLLTSGAPKGTVVAILAEDPVEFITSVLGILKAGCVFVPLDPGIPEKRLAAMIAEVSPAWFVTEPKLAGLLARAAEGSAARVICAGGAPEGAEAGGLDFAREYASYYDPSRPAVAYDPDDMCNVFFTSGSTGRPKGIAGRLKGIGHFVRWEIKALGLGEGVRVSQLTSFGFDAVLRDIFVPLCAGGTVCVPPGRETLLDPRQLIDWLDIQGVNVVHCVPSLFRSMLREELNGGYFAELTHVLMSGEPLLPSDVGRWASKFGDRVQLVNLYGPTETTMTKFAYFVKPSDKDRDSIPIGKPIEGAAAVVVDTEGRPCVPGAVGEIYIRTPYRTLGYFNQPALTREVFVPNPFGTDPEDIVYKTGDLARVLPDGDFEFLGRRDQQVKIRGTRIELGEIEKALREHEAVKDLAVVALDDAGGTKYLCAYLVLGREVETGELRDYLGARLPAEMVPSSFVVLDRLPRTISGKVDRKALPAPGRSGGGVERAFVAPRTPVEQMVAEIWAEVLGVERVGVNDNFFETGGHSLLVFQVISRVRDIFDLELPLRSLFEAPTVEKQALAIIQAQVEQESEAEMAQLLEEVRLLGDDEPALAESKLQLVEDTEEA